jgi:hypothetical protein
VVVDRTNPKASERAEFTALAGMYEYYKVKFTLRRAGHESGGDNLLMEVVVFASLAVINWAFKKGKK